MALHVNATYVDGVLRLDEPLDLKHFERVHVVVHVAPAESRTAYGLLSRLGDSKILEQIAVDPEFGVVG